MTLPALSHYAIPVQYVRHANVTANTRPYESAGALAQQVSLFSSVEPLPQENHYRVELTAQLRAVSESGEVRFQVDGVIEAIAVVAAELSEDRRNETLRVEVCAALVGTMRTLMTTLSLGTGYGPLVLPAISAAQLAQLVPPPSKVA